jgi:hypothetical protein
VQVAEQVGYQTAVDLMEELDTILGPEAPDFVAVAAVAVAV